MDAVMVVPTRFGEVDVLVQAVSMTQAGSEDVGITDRLCTTYSSMEPAILAVASSVAETIGRFSDHATKPTEVQVEFGVGLSMGGDVVLVKGEATLAITLTYDSA